MKDLETVPQGCKKGLAAGTRPLHAPRARTIGGEPVMQTQWIFSSTFLPHVGEPVDFMLEDRGQSIRGTFSDGSFHSRWADYDAQRVKSWRGSGNDPSDVQATAKAAPTGAFLGMLKRWVRPLSANRRAVPMSPRSHSRRTATSIDTRPVAAKARRIDSNQISS
jgi:hypothetical protein